METEVLKSNFFMEITIDPTSVFTLPYNGQEPSDFEAPTISRRFPQESVKECPHNDALDVHPDSLPRVDDGLYHTPAPSSELRFKPILVQTSKHVLRQSPLKAAITKPIIDASEAVPKTGHEKPVPFLDLKRPSHPRRVVTSPDSTPDPPAPLNESNSSQLHLTRQIRKHRDFTFSWFEASGVRIPKNPPPFVSDRDPKEGDIFLFNQVETDNVQIWTWEGDRWGKVDIGQVKNIDGRLRELKIKDDGSPSWILQESARRYKSKSRA